MIGTFLRLSDNQLIILLYSDEGVKQTDKIVLTFPSFKINISTMDFLTLGFQLILSKPVKTTLFIKKHFRALLYSKCQINDSGLK